MRLIDADRLKGNVLEWMPSDPCGIEEKEFSYETDIVVSLMMEIEEAPTIEQPTWIPCSERLPSMRTEVIYSYDGIVSTGYITDRDCIGEKTEEHWEDLESGAYIEPIAWMPLPKPYREDGE